MKKLIRIIKKHFILLLGVGLFFYNFFNFGSGAYEGLSGCHRGGGAFSQFENFYNLPECPSVYPVATYYYYSHTTLILLTIGVLLILIGLLRIEKTSFNIKK